MAAGRTSPRDPTAPRICLDFGTSLSKACIYLGPAQDSRLSVAPLSLGAVSGAVHPLMTPSALFVDANRLYFGPPALRQARTALKAQREPILSFKTLMSARDVDAVLNLKLSIGVDPTGSLNNRDALVIYFAYLDQLIRAAIAGDTTLPEILREAPLRLTTPLWQGVDVWKNLARLFAHAEQVSARLGPALIAEGGVDMAQVREQLAAGPPADGPQRIDGVTLEGQGVASTYFAFARPQSDYLLVVDIGSGTTDVAGFALDRQARRLVEIEQARLCSALSCDEIDHIVLDAVLRQNPLRSQEEKEDIWRSLRLSVRDFKRGLLASGERRFSYEGKTITISSNTLNKHPSMRAFREGVVRLVTEGLEAVAAQVDDPKRDTIAICLAGGGSNLWLLESAAREAATKHGWRDRVGVQRFVDEWLPETRYKPLLLGVFPQIAASMGGALAVDSFVLNERPGGAPA